MLHDNPAFARNERRMNIFSEFEQRIKNILSKSDIVPQGGGVLDLSRVSVEAPRDESHGDLATNAAMVLAKTIGLAPRLLAERIAPWLEKSEDVDSVNVAGPGFINLRLTQNFWHGVLATIIAKGSLYGASDLGQGKSINVEYVSANPTGPLHVGHCRGAVVGDALANLLQFAGFEVTKEYYINDAGGQIDVLAASTFLRYREALGETVEIGEGFYPGDYLKKVGEDLALEFGRQLLDMAEDEARAIAGERAVVAMLVLIRADLAMLNVNQDIFFSEKSLYADAAAAIRTAINDLTLRGYVYRGKLPPPKGQRQDDWEDREQLLLRSSDVGDDMDRPLVKSDGSYTYFASDVAYFKNKYDRGFDEMIYVLGADHSGYVKRLEAVAKAVSEDKVRLNVLLCQTVKLWRDGAPVTMSKRSGNFITLRDVVDEVGSDPVRFMMLYRKCDAPLDFDFARVSEQSKDNPVFYVQYAHARCYSIFRQAREQSLQTDKQRQPDFSLLRAESELALIRKMAEYPRLIESAATSREPHRLAFYLYDLASLFHTTWNKGNEDQALRFVKVDDEDLTYARLALVRAVSHVIASGLGIIGVTAPEEMR